MSWFVLIAVYALIVAITAYNNKDFDAESGVSSVGNWLLCSFIELIWIIIWILAIHN